MRRKIHLSATRLLRILFLLATSCKYSSDAPVSDDAKSTPIVDAEKPNEINPKIDDIYGGHLAKVERTLLHLGVDREFRFVNFRIGGIDRIEIAILPKAIGNPPYLIEFMLSPESADIGDPTELLQWLDSDELLARNGPSPNG